MMTRISKTKIVMHYITWCKQTFCLYLFLARANVEGDVCRKLSHEHFEYSRISAKLVAHITL